MPNGDYSYTDAGFDAFLSRSIDNTPGVNLSSDGPMSTAIRYDSSQLSGGMGDAYTMGGISMSGKDSSVTVNDGVIIVNDTSTNNVIQASSGNITYADSTGNTVIQEGVLADNTTGIRALDVQQRTVAQLGRFTDRTTAFKIYDTNGLGIAQFGQFPDGSVALKVAKAGHEVSTTTNDQLIFNSNQDIFKIIASGTATVTVPDPLVNNSEVTTTVVHGISGTPGVIAYLVGNGDAYQSSGTSYQVPWHPAGFFGLTYTYYINSSVVTFSVANYVGGNVSGLSNATFRYYILQETATT